MLFLDCSFVNQGFSIHGTLFDANALESLTLCSDGMGGLVDLGKVFYMYGMIFLRLVWLYVLQYIRDF